MKKPTAAQQRFFDNATFIAATRLIFDKLAKHHKPKKLSDVVTIFNGQSLKKSERQDDGIFDVYGSGGLVGNYSESLSDNPFVVIGRKGSAGKPTYAPFGGWVIDTAYYAQPNDSDALSTKFLYYAISSLDFSDDIISTAIPGINRTAIYKHPIPIPPIDIQIAVSNFLDATKNKTTLPALPDELADIHRIVARIEALAARVAEAQSLRREASDEANSLERSFLDQVYKSCVEKFGTTEFEKVCDTITDGDHITPRFSDEGVKFIFVGNVSSGVLHFRNCKYVTPEYFAGIRPQRKAKLGDILYSAVGATLGVPAIVDQDEDFCFQRHIAIIKPNRGKLNSKFLWYTLRSATIFNIAWANTTGSAQPTVPLNAIRRFPIPVPPLEEQRRLVAYLDGLQAQVSALRAAQAESARELSALLPSVLDRAFKGEL